MNVVFHKDVCNILNFSPSDVRDLFVLIILR